VPPDTKPATQSPDAPHPDVGGLLDGSTTKRRSFVHRRLADGKIVVQDVMTNPDMMPVLAQLLAPPTGR